MTKNVSLVTGATGGMGRVIAASLAKQGAAVVLVCRDASAGAALQHEIGADGVLSGDLSTAEGVRKIADGFRDRYERLDLLINNAGAHFRDRQVTADGIERHVAVNYLAGFLLTELLLDRLQAPARVVNVVSEAMADARTVKIGRRPRPVALGELGDLRKVNGPEGFEPFQAYGRAKLLATMAGLHLAARLDGTGVTVNAVHPGIVATGIVDDMASPLMKPFLGPIKRGLLTPAQGAAAILRVASLEGVTGGYHVRDSPQRAPEIAYDREAQERLWAASKPFIG